MHSDGPAVIEIEYCLPEYSKCVHFFDNNLLNAMIVTRNQHIELYIYIYLYISDTLFVFVKYILRLMASLKKIYIHSIKQPSTHIQHTKILSLSFDFHSCVAAASTYLLNTLNTLEQTIFIHQCIVSQNSLCVTTKLAQITVERENNCFGLTLRGGGDYPLIVTNVRPHGPVFKTGRIKPGDRLLRVDNVSIYSFEI